MSTGVVDTLESILSEKQVSDGYITSFALLEDPCIYAKIFDTFPEQITRYLHLIITADWYIRGTEDSKEYVRLRRFFRRAGVSDKQLELFRNLYLSGEFEKVLGRKISEVPFIPSDYLTPEEWCAKAYRCFGWYIENYLREYVNTMAAMVDSDMDLSHLNRAENLLFSKGLTEKELAIIRQYFYSKSRVVNFNITPEELHEQFGIPIEP